MTRKRRLMPIATALILVLVASGPSAALRASVPVPSSDPAVPAVPADVPDTLVSIDVTSYDLAAPKLFWHTVGCIPTPTALTNTATEYTETIKRVAAYGGLTRTLWANRVAYPECDNDVYSDNIVADEDYVYWVSRALGGVVRLPTDANPGHAPELLNDIVSGPSELAQDDKNVYVMSKTGGGIYRISKANGSRERITSNPGTAPHDLQADGKYVYWIARGVLRRAVRSSTFPVVIWNIAEGVTGYHAEGRHFAYFTPSGAGYSEYVFIGQGRRVVRYNNVSGTTSDPIYTSSDGSASVHALVSDPAAYLDGQVFLIESREVSCGMFCSYENVLVRVGSGGGAADTLHTTGTGTATIRRIASHVELDGDFVFWQEEDAVKRLPQDADALPLTNMRITGLEITQSVQDLSNSVALIEKRRTFVRLYVESDGDAVPGVTAYLYKTNSRGAAVAGPLVPVNPVGQQITVHPYSPFYRLGLNRGFLFELPWDWTEGTLYLRAVLNPNRVPPQASYANNYRNAGPLVFQPSPRLQVQFVSFGYELDGQTYYPHLIDDVFQTYSWIRRTYPVASTPGSASDPTPGFRPNLWVMYFDGLGSFVDGSNHVCSILYPDPKHRSLCASAVTNAVMKQLRVENGVPGNVFMYGMISDRAGYFPRGQASGSGNVSSGPAGSGTWGWDTDGSYADWYAGHEIGHTLGRNHPYKGSQEDTGVCNQGTDDGALDPNYPYLDGRLSSIPATMWGFDVGDAAFGLPIQLYPGGLWFDVMTYCGYLWLSDYTYDGMYSYMMSHPTGYLKPSSSVAARVAGDFLGVYGSLASDGEMGVIHSLRRVSSVVSMPPLLPSAETYRIRLLDGGGAVLADYGFTPEPADNTPTLSFGQVVTFVPGTAHVQIIKGADDRVLASASISENAPTVSDVALEGASFVVAGTVTLTWTASDADGDTLSFDIHYSADGGASFQPLRLGVDGDASTSSDANEAQVVLQEGAVEIDTAKLAGSDEAVLRVVATDGVQTGYGDSAPFVMEHKPPEPRILTPANGTQVHYGQLVNFSGEAMDAQDGSVPAADLIWTIGRRLLGTGPLISVDDLPVGANQVTLTAQNSAGLYASTSITVLVDDDLSLPGPTLSVAPTQVGWHVSASTTAAQTEGVDISNAGGGTLDWTAKEDAAWLTLDATSGTAPATLGLIADPSGLEDGAVLSTTVRITSPAAGAHLTETTDVPVSLLVGDVYHLYPGGRMHQAYLPLVLRGS